MDNIKGMLFHVKGSELRDLMSARATWHANRVEDLRVNRGVAEKALEDASKAAELAGTAGRSGVRPSARRSLSGGSLEIMASASSNRQYGDSMEDPVSAIDAAIAHHSSRAVSLKFYADHVLSERTYELGVHEISSFELLGSDEDA